ncbi:MAG: hypothetical protein WC444_06705 [Candidatus Paceibacterota bacterium]
MNQVKLRAISSRHGNESFGVTIPIEIASKYEGTYFHVTERDGCILLVSGCHAEVKRDARENKIGVDVRFANV